MVNAEEYQLDGRQFLTADDVLTLLLVGRVQSHHALITCLARDDLRMTFAEAVKRLVGLLQSGDEVASALAPETQERIRLTRLDFAEIAVEHKEHGHVIKPSRLDGDHPLSRGYYNVLRIDAQAFLRHFAPRAVIHLVRPASPLLVVADSSPATRTGAPGRPTSMHHIVAEFERRRAAKVPLADTLKAEAAALADWFARNHEDSPVPKVGTVENNIRGPFNKARASHPTK
jgi:hypothetical protein